MASQHIGFMRYTISFLVILYAVSAIIDVTLGIETVNHYISYTLWVGSATAITAICIYILSKGRPIMPLPFILGSLAQSIVAFILGRVDSANIPNIAIKALATVLTIKPQIIEIEVETTTENEEESYDSSRKTGN